MARYVRGSQSLLFSTRSRDQELGENQTTTFLQRAVPLLNIIVLYYALHLCNGMSPKIKENAEHFVIETKKNKVSSLTI